MSDDNSQISVQSVPDHVKRRRSTVACEVCRIAKTRCQDVVGGRCSRCRMAAVNCVFSSRRRGSNTQYVLATFRRANPIRERPPPPQSPPTIPGIPTTPATAASLASGTRQSPAEDSDITTADFPVDSVEYDLAEQSRTLPFTNPLAFLVEQSSKSWGRESRKLSLPPAPPLTDEETQLYECWTSSLLETVARQQTRFSALGVHGSKMDVAPGLDAVQRGLVPENRVKELFDAFYQWANPQFGLMDASLHTPTFVRGRSALLFSTILSIGATALATLPNSTKQSIDLARALFAHTEKLHLVICAAAAKSIEIVQAELLKSVWTHLPGRSIDDPRATRLAMLTHIATDIGLQHRRRHPCTRLLREKLELNDIKTRMAMLCLEANWGRLRDGRLNSAFELFGLTDAEWARIRDLDRSSPHAILVARYAVYRYELQSRERLRRALTESESPMAIEAERSLLRTLMVNWRERWAFGGEDGLRSSYVQVQLLGDHMWNLLRVNRLVLDQSAWSPRVRSELLEVCLEILSRVLQVPMSLHMFPFEAAVAVAASLVYALTNEGDHARGLILRVGLLMAGDPGKGRIHTYGTYIGSQLLSMVATDRPWSGNVTVAALPNVTTPLPSTLMSNVMPAGLDHLMSYDANAADFSFPYFPNETSDETMLADVALGDSFPEDWWKTLDT